MRKSRGITLLRTLGFSCLSFSRSLPLFSSACGLFCQKHGGWGCLGDISAPSASRRCHPSSIFKTFVFINLQIPFSVTPLAAHLYKTPGCHPCSGLSITLPPSHSWTCALLFRLDFVPRTKYCSTANYFSRECVR